MTPNDPLIAALAPLTSRVRTDVTAVKREGRQAWTREELTPERLAKHLNGGPARGVSQIKPGQSVTMVALLDFDSHGGEVAWPQMTEAAARVYVQLELVEGLQPIAFRSSGGRGIHLYVLWERAQDAYSVRELLKRSLRACGYESGTRGVAAGEVEVFPKQNEVPAGGFGNQAVLPLAGQSVPLAYEELVDDLVLLERSDVLGMRWPVCEVDVPVLERPARLQHDPGLLAGVDVELMALLDAIPNMGARALGYDEWRNVLFAIHHEAGSGDEGLALAHAFSAKSDKYDPDFLDNRVWPYITSERSGAVITRGTLKRIAGGYGWHEPLNADAFEDISGADDRPPVPTVPQMENKTERPSGGGGGKSALPAVRRRGIPEAHFLTTDQANANRIRAAYGALLFVAAGKWYVWDGMRWIADEGDVYRYACRLSDMVRSESKDWAARAAKSDADGDSAGAKTQAAVAKALGSWAVKCEMKGTIEAAVGLLRKMLTVEVDALDRDPWALNTLSGIVDLRTGEVKRHDPGAYITRLVPVRYVPEAGCDEWVRVLRQITREDGSGPNGEAEAKRGAGVVDFLQRWAGYCLTGSTREQALVVHWGPGSNGKSVVLEMLAETMGDYAGTAAPGLLMASKTERHPTEIADLMGRRMVTAHESGEGMVLREDFIKQATGSDRLTARYMRGDFFEFEPTHKLQLVTNHKPQVKGQDLGIWRRMMLLEYGALFGTAAQVEAGTHTHVKDVDLLARLRGELEGVLAWRVRGAVAWFTGGLVPPAKVLAATAGYRSQQDRVGQFVAECCEVGTEFEEPLAEGMSGGLYPAYHDWCKDAGILPLSKPRFKDDVLRVVPRAFAGPRKSGTANRKIVIIVHGLRLLPE